MLSAFQYAVNQLSLLRFMDTREIRFKLVTDASEVDVDGVWFDVMAHVDSVEAESVCSGFHWKAVKVDQTQIRIQG